MLRFILLWDFIPKCLEIHWLMSTPALAWHSEAFCHHAPQEVSRVVFEFEIKHMPLKPRQCKVKLSPARATAAGLYFFFARYYLWVPDFWENSGEYVFVQKTYCLCHSLYWVSRPRGYWWKSSTCTLTWNHKCIWKYSQIFIRSKEGLRDIHYLTGQRV